MENYSAVYSVLRSAIWGFDRYPYDYDETTDWEAIYTELRHQAVAGLAADVIVSSEALPVELKTKILHKTMKGIGFFHRVMTQQQELLKIMNGAGIPFVVLKGAAAAVYYPKPENRSMGDVDLIVLPWDFDRAAQLMLDNGFEPLDLKHDRHYEYRKNGVNFELHRYFSLTDDTSSAKAFDEMIFARIQEPRMRTIGAFHFPSLPELENGLVLLIHIAQHMERGGIGLRQIIDWMHYADQILDECFWHEEFEPAARAFGLQKLAVTVTRMCQMYLGLREEGISWCSGSDEDLCCETITVIMERGNFGRKIGKSSNTIQAIYEMKNIFHLPKQLQKRGEANWKALDRFPFLRPFAWLYQLCRYIRKGLSRKNPLRQLAEDVADHQKDADLLSRLGIGHR